jgi:hypothetical protein
MCVLVFSTNLSETFLIIWCNERDVKNVYRSSCKVPFISCQILMKLDFFRRIFEKFSNIKFHENPFSGSRIVPWRRKDGQTNGYDEAYSRFSHLCERAWICIMMLLSYGTVSPTYCLPSRPTTSSQIIPRTLSLTLYLSSLINTLLSRSCTVTERHRSIVTNLVSFRMFP